MMWPYKNIYITQRWVFLHIYIYIYIHIFIHIHTFFFSLLKFQITSEKLLFFFYKNEGNNTKVENKVSGRVRVGVGGLYCPNKVASI